jgi:tRNA1(Val) A37 N6-methylase TrmN6
VVEAGCGVGGALLAAAARQSGAVFVGVERDAAMLALTLTNIAANAMGDRVQALHGDVSAGFRQFGLPLFDAAIANPPYYDSAASIRGPAPAREGAYLADAGLAVWIGFLIKAVREGGAITLIHRADRLGDILAHLAPKAGSVRIRPIHPFADQPAKRVLVRAIKSGKAPLAILPPLVLHAAGHGKHTSETEAILRGHAAIAWHTPNGP